MEQVPRTYGIVGSGRLSVHLLRYFSLLRIPVVHWARYLSTDDPKKTLSSCSTILLAISDSQIEPFCRKNDYFYGKTLIHFSGSLVSSLAHGAHPLMSFGPELYSLEEYRTMSFVTEKGGPQLKELLPELDNPSYAIAPEQKARYHALCVMAGNFTTLLWKKFFDDTSSLGIPKEAGVPYLRAIFDNLSEAHALALTGPLARKDFSTIEKNIAALQGDPFKEIYRSFVKAHLGADLRETKEIST